MTRPVLLHLCTRYLRGGSERRIRDAIAAVPEARHHLVVGPDSHLDLARAQTGAERVQLLPSLVRQVSLVADTQTLLILRRMLRGGRYAAVVTHQSKAGVLGRVAARTAGVPVVHSLSMASFGPGYRALESRVFRLVEGALASRTDVLCAVGHDLARRFVEIGAPPDRVRVVRSGVPLPSVVPSREQALAAVAARHDLPAGRPLLLHVGSLDERKGVLRLPELLAGATRQWPGPRPFLVVAGEGPQHAALAGRLDALGLAGDARLLGHMPDVPDLMRAAQVLVLLSSAEGMPQVLVQAAAVGTPFVAYDVDGVQELRALGARGDAVPLGDLAAASAAVAGWLHDTGPREVTADLAEWRPEAVAAGWRSALGSVLPLPERGATLAA